MRSLPTADKSATRKLASNVFLRRSSLVAKAYPAPSTLLARNGVVGNDRFIYLLYNALAVEVGTETPMKSSCGKCGYIALSGNRSSITPFRLLI